jgi:ABC-type multidrug transport system ATPase subunit
MAHAKRIFKDCIRNNLKKGRCIVMMTQQKKFLNECDLVLVMKSGKCIISNTYL